MRFVTDVSLPAPHQVSRDRDITYCEQWRRNRVRDKEKGNAHLRPQNDRCEEDTRHRITGAERSIFRFPTVSIVDNHCREDSRTHVYKQHAQRAKPPFDDGPEVVERHHIEKKMSAV